MAKIRHSPGFPVVQNQQHAKGGIGGAGSPASAPLRLWQFDCSLTLGRVVGGLLPTLYGLRSLGLPRRLFVAIKARGGKRPECVRCNREATVGAVRVVGRLSPG